MSNQKIDNNLIEKLIADRKVRVAATFGSHLLFQHVYLNRYITHETAPFQKEMLKITEDNSNKLSVIVAFRGSAKSTIMTLSYPIWAIIGKPKKKFIVIISQTQQQAKLHLSNLKTELESNELLRNELGPFKENDEWGSSSIVIPKLDARITAVSSEQSIRGLRHGPYRPQLIICDDVEDLASVKTKEGRDKTYRWLTGEVIPCGDTDTKIIVIGNLLHEDSLLMRLKETIQNKQLNGDFYYYPIINDQNKIMWPGKLKTMVDVEALKKNIGNEIAWQREFMLRIVPDEGQVIHPEWLHYYDNLPSFKGTECRFTATGVDLAISQKSTADYTAMVSANIHGFADKRRIYILPNPVNERLNFPQTIDRIELLANTAGPTTQQIYIEEVGYQKAAIQQLIKNGIQVEGFKVGGNDKHTRLALTSKYIHNGSILFPRTGAENLIQQLVGFGVEKHDDLADAFSTLILKIMENKDVIPEIWTF